MELGSAEQYRIPTFFLSGNRVLIISACLSRGARSAVPVTLVPVVPFQSAMDSAVP